MIKTSQSCLSGLESCLQFLERKGCLLADCSPQGLLKLTRAKRSEIVARIHELERHAIYGRS